MINRKLLTFLFITTAGTLTNIQASQLPMLPSIDDDDSHPRYVQNNQQWQQPYGQPMQQQSYGQNTPGLSFNIHNFYLAEGNQIYRVAPQYSRPGTVALISPPSAPVPLLMQFRINPQSKSVGFTTYNMLNKKPVMSGSGYIQGLQMYLNFTDIFGKRGSGVLYINHLPGQHSSYPQGGDYPQGG